MTEYRVYLRSDIQWAMRTFKARSPQHAVKLAHRFVEKRSFDLDFEDYDSLHCPINEIEVCDDQGNELAVWHDDDMRLRLAAPALLAAAQNVLACWEQGDLAAAVRKLDAAVAEAKG